MKTAEEFVKEYYQIPQSGIQTVRIKSLIKCLERYAEQLNKPCVSNNEVAVCPNCGSHDIGKYKHWKNIFCCDTCDWFWAN